MPCLGTRPPRTETTTHDCHGNERDLEQPYQQVVLSHSISTCERVKLDPYFIPQIEINFKWTRSSEVNSSKAESGRRCHILSPLNSGWMLTTLMLSLQKLSRYKDSYKIQISGSECNLCLTVMDTEHYRALTNEKYIAEGTVKFGKDGLKLKATATDSNRGQNRRTGNIDMDWLPQPRQGDRMIHAWPTVTVGKPQPEETCTPALSHPRAQSLRSRSTPGSRPGLLGGKDFHLRLPPRAASPVRSAAPRARGRGPPGPPSREPSPGEAVSAAPRPDTSPGRVFPTNHHARLSASAPSALRLLGPSAVRPFGSSAPRLFGPSARPVPHALAGPARALPPCSRWCEPPLTTSGSRVAPEARKFRKPEEAALAADKASLPENGPEKVPRSGRGRRAAKVSVCPREARARPGRRGRPEPRLAPRAPLGGPGLRLPGRNVSFWFREKQ
ncbi:PREDICTED: translation initiation factor IF-2-like [Chinchilla lanigera]|uniref:translation initiation factor IF-2-like n=1 Tax=Chinchilla lanigera TaxID=34839 RepID=UPI0006972331|nr:PREDICTED: translation initiation factor IF-2-like [Chinchilla lanigera]